MPTIINPTSPAGITGLSLRDMLKRSATFIANVTAAGGAVDDHVSHDMPEATEQSLVLPFASVILMTDHDYMHKSGGGNPHLRPVGSHMLFLWYRVSESNEKHEQAEIEAADYFDNVICEIAEKSGKDDGVYTGRSYSDFVQIEIQDFGVEAERFEGLDSDLVYMLAAKFWWGERVGGQV